MSSMALEEGTNELLYVAFNQDFGCFSCGTDTGFRIYNCDPFKETFRRDFSSGGIGIVEMLFRCNILALVGGGSNPRFPPNKVMIWDDLQNRCIGELSFRSEVKAVKLRRDRIVVVLQTKLYVYNFVDLKLIDHIETHSNPKGLCALCPHSTNTVLACPGLQRGHVKVELYNIRKTTTIDAHEAELSCMALNMEGTRLATSSEKGTLVRLFDTQTGRWQQELRRGADRAEIFSIAISPDSKYLAVSSDKGTVHVFRLSDASRDAAAITGGAAAAGGGGSGGGGGGAAGGDGEAGAPAAGEEEDGGAGEAKEEADDIENKSSTFSFMKSLLPKYFSSEWSFAQFRVGDARTVVAFGAEKNTLLVVGSDGSFYKAKFDASGECEKKSYSRFVKSVDDDEEEDA
eukprot:PLAT1791.1.p1 GENE.PLAT1791.1~~PLAT1791.1.p1  ORF type:complete len:401 (+),score=228.29 PLAT1791.1:55-1257(+)